MFIDFFLKRFEKQKDNPAIIWRDKEYTYEWLTYQIKYLINIFNQNGEIRSKVISLEADYSPYSIAILFSLIELGCIVVPIRDSLVDVKKSEYCQITEIEKVIKINGESFEIIEKEKKSVRNNLLLELKNKRRPGLIIFSSGTTGKSKAIVHDFSLFLQKFNIPKKGKRVISFMLFDHIGGINTLFQILSSNGCLVVVKERIPYDICRVIEKYKVQALPVSPTFLNLLILSRAYNIYDLSSLETISYGSEVMAESTLKKLNEIFPGVKIQQIYGLSEAGVFNSKSKSGNSLWVKLDEESVKIRIVNGVLQIKSLFSLLGYINAENPFTEDGWLITGDIAEKDGEYIKILGRKSDIINVGGEKVFPVEVESVIQLMYGVEEVAVMGEKNPITGQMVKAIIKLNTNETLGEFRKRMKEFCKDKLPTYKIPQKVILTSKIMHSERFKKSRNP